jgi:hypothetical protein
MTKVQLQYPLVRKLQDEDAEAVAKVHGFYGIVKVTLAPDLAEIRVDYDASRLSKNDVEMALVRYGVPIQR